MADSFLHDSTHGSRGSEEAPTSSPGASSAAPSLAHVSADNFSTQTAFPLDETIERPIPENREELFNELRLDLVRPEALLYHRGQAACLIEFFKTTEGMLVDSPMDSGKTFMALVAASSYLQADDKVLFLTPQRHLVTQVIESAKNILFVSEDEVCAATGSEGEKGRTKLYSRSGALLIVATPEGIRNDLKSGVLDPNIFGLVVFDEAHKAKGFYAYVPVAEKFKTARTRQLVMSGTPVSADSDMISALKDQDSDRLGRGKRERTYELMRCLGVGRSHRVEYPDKFLESKVFREEVRPEVTRAVQKLLKIGERIYNDLLVEFKEHSEMKGMVNFLCLSEKGKFRFPHQPPLMRFTNEIVGRLNNEPSVENSDSRVGKSRKGGVCDEAAIEEEPQLAMAFVEELSGEVETSVDIIEKSTLRKVTSLCYELQEVCRLNVALVDHGKYRFLSRVADKLIDLKLSASTGSESKYKKSLYESRELDDAFTEIAGSIEGSGSFDPQSINLSSLETPFACLTGSSSWNSSWAEFSSQVLAPNEIYGKTQAERKKNFLTRAQDILQNNVEFIDSAVESKLISLLREHIQRGERDGFLVFVDHTQDALFLQGRLRTQLSDCGTSIEVFHGKLKAGEAEQIKTNFNKGGIDILIATQSMTHGHHVKARIGIVISQTSQSNVLAQRLGRIGRDDKVLENTEGAGNKPQPDLFSLQGAGMYYLMSSGSRSERIFEKGKVGYEATGQGKVGAALRVKLE